MQDASQTVAETFKVKTLEHNGVKLTYRCSEYDAYEDNFTYLGMNEDDSPREKDDK